jgi:nucleoside-diphosphate kinase
MERTLIVIKPDAVERKLIGSILTRFENKGFTILQLKMLTMTIEQAEEFYLPHKSKSFFPSLVKFITSGPVVAIMLEGSSAVDVVRLMVGSTKSFEAMAGTIRGDFGLGLKDNVIHATDSAESFEREVKVVF